MKDFSTLAYDSFHRSWALVTAGNTSDFNTMTVSWGGVGCLWNRPVATVYVRPSRYTYEYMEANEYFTVSFFPEEQRNALKILGTLSGRDSDKVAQSGLTAMPCGESIAFREAELTLLCRKIYRQDMDPAQVPAEVRERFYGEGETFHRIYIGEIISVQGGS